MFEAVTGYHIKIKLAKKLSVPLFTLRLQYSKIETSETLNICMLMATFLLM